MRGEPVERTPVWAMRQAGRWDPQFQALRRGYSFYEFSEQPDLAAQASLCPRRFGVDAIILFYDITTLSVAMGQPFTLQPELGPTPEQPIRTLAHVEQLTAQPDVADYRHILELLRLVKQELAGELPILVFAGAPFTLATYQIGTGKDIQATRTFIDEQPIVWQALLERIALATGHFLQSLLDAGAVAYQLFDSWAGALTEREYLQFAQPYHEQIFSTVTGPSILFVKDGPYLELMARSGAKVLSLSKQYQLDQVKQAYPNLIVQGNVDHEMFIHCTPAQVAAATRDCLAAGGGQRHILNLDHGMDRQATVDNFVAFVQQAKLYPAEWTS